MIVFWSRPAIDDLKAIHAYIAEGSEYYAAEFIRRLMRMIDRLETFPELGHKVRDIQDPAARELVFQNYRVLYRLKPDRIDIAGVIHGRRDISKHVARWEVI